MKNYKNVYCFIPNLLGYIRLLLIVIAFPLFFQYPYWFVGLYTISQSLDGLDGFLARKLSQTSTYGALLDMMIDRSSTLVLFVLLTHFYPHYLHLFVAFTLLDINAHFAYLYSTLLAGKSSHKTISPHQSWLLKWYYGAKGRLALLCIGGEAYLLSLYLLHFKDRFNEQWVSILHYVSSIFFFFKQLINFIHLVQAMKDTVRLKQ